MKTILNYLKAVVDLVGWFRNRKPNVFPVTGDRPDGAFPLMVSLKTALDNAEIALQDAATALDRGNKHDFESSLWMAKTMIDIAGQHWTNNN